MLKFFREMTALTAVVWLVLGALTFAGRVLSAVACLVAVVLEQVADATSHGRAHLRARASSRWEAVA